MVWHKQTLIGKIRYEVDSHGHIWQTVIQGVNETRNYMGTLTCDPLIFGMELKEKGFEEV